jgi:hypothetical protein
MHQTRPAVPDSIIRGVTETLARWLPSRDDTGAPGDWGADEWLAAEWIAYWQNALPWLHQKVMQAGPALPHDTRESLTALASISRQRTSRMLDAAAELIAALRARDVDVLPFKGALLAPLYYPDPQLRPLADLDLLVRESDLRVVIAVTEQLGYRYYSRSAEDFVYLRGARKANVWSPDNVHPVELHFRIREEYAGLAYDLTDVLWSSATRGAYWNGADALIATAPIALHHVCAHMTSDLLIQRGKLMEIGDVQVMAARMRTADWQTFLASIPSSGARFVYPALALAERYAVGSIPASVLDMLRAQVPEPLRAWCARVTLADASESNPAPRSGIGLGMARMLAQSRFERFRMWLRSMFPRRWNLVKRYPRLAASPLYPLCYVLINLDRAWQLFRIKLLRQAL